ncbi:DnaJ domain-containing protein [Rubrimonas cliftonensis]|uniref:DnaJ domain-containing protein n=1 Tax=Rubrimonas cliftonensis TaxID=89524 RepID=A0A1H3XD74_9RHOB|nr:DnaJ domain-containing protein [Rubrimonas cliftonensis]SDZ96634.1 DnaJ domain-containing protein [Rubrimonas cliftonensis]
MSPALAPLLIAAAWLAVSLLRAHGGALAPRTARRAGVAALAAAALLLAARQLPLAAALAAAGVGLLMSRRPAAGGGAGGVGAGGAPSRVETAALAMVLDPADGSMDGEVRAGAFAGRNLSGMDRTELLRLAAEIDADDGASLRLLSGYLDWRFPGWRDEDRAAGADDAPAMSRREALRVLGLDDGADEAAVRAAYRRLMKKVHPDQGGTAELAARVQAARDVLLG